MFGQTTLSNSTINPTRVSADGNPDLKAGGLTIDWTTVTAVSGSDVTLADGSVIRIGQKYLRYGQVMCKITGGTNTLTVSGSPTGGTFTVTVTNGQGVAATTGTIAYNAAASAVQTAIAALANVGTGNVSVTGSSGGPWTVTFATALGTMTVALGTNSLTGGTSPTVAVGATLAAGTTVGYYGPYDPSASDGRQTLTRGAIYVLDETVLQYRSQSSALGGANDNVGGAIEGGLVWNDRILQSGTATHTLALGPTQAEIETAFPNLRFVRNA
jgi:hypothetical protein